MRARTLASVERAAAGWAIADRPGAQWVQPDPPFRYLGPATEGDEDNRGERQGRRLTGMKGAGAGPLRFDTKGEPK